MKTASVLILVFGLVAGSCSNPRHSQSPPLEDGTYPNPFSPTVTVIEFQGPIDQPNVFALYNMSGEVVYRVENITAGTYKIADGQPVRDGEGEEPPSQVIRFDVRGLDSGIYFWRITTPDWSDTKKIVVGQ